MFELIYDEEAFKVDAPEDVVSAFLEKAEKALEAEGVFTLSFVSPAEIQRLNREYRSKDEVTDVLTFAMSDGEEFPAFPGEEKELGDVFICLERMKDNAKEFGVSEEEELKRLCLHGLMHLLGYDHESNDFTLEPMLIKQEEILKGCF